MLLANCCLPGGASYAILADYQTLSNLTIKNNTITFDTSGRGLIQFRGVMTYLLNTATISDNTVGVVNTGYGVTNDTSGSGLTMFNNRTPTGALIPALNNQ